MGTFSWETGNPVTAREHFCNEGLGWLLSARLWRDDTSTSIRTRYSLETDKSLKAAHSPPRPKKGSKCSNMVRYMCYVYYYMRAVKIELASKRAKIFPPEVRTLQTLCPLCEKNPPFHTLHDSDFVSFQIVTLRIELEFYTSILAFHIPALRFRTSYITKESNICFHTSYTKDITTSMCKGRGLVANVDVILLRERSSPSPILRLGLR